MPLWWTDKTGRKNGFASEDNAPGLIRHTASNLVGVRDPSHRIWVMWNIGTSEEVFIRIFR
jgi:hypothetical protein